MSTSNAAVLSYPEVLESAIKWGDSRRIFMCPSEAGRMLCRMEVECEAIDDGVIDAIENLERALVEAVNANAIRRVLTLVPESPH